MIQLKNFSIGYKKNILLKNVETIFPKGELTALIGRNGSGKSTLLKAICGLNNTYSGEIIIDKENIRDISKNRLASLVSYVNTRRPRVSNMKCKEMVALGRTPHTLWHGSLSSKDYEIINMAIEKTGMSNYIDRLFDSLSDGEAQKIMIARAIAQQTPIIILDEPTSFLDIPSRYELITLLKNLAKEEKTIIYSTHELDLALKFSDDIALIDSPRLITLPASEIIDSPLLNSLIPNK